MHAGDQGPKALETLASGAGMLGSWKVILQGDFSGIPFTAFWCHRCACMQFMQLQFLGPITRSHQCMSIRQNQITDKWSTRDAPNWVFTI